jgi:hypothetical protein
MHAALCTWVTLGTLDESFTMAIHAPVLIQIDDCKNIPNVSCMKYICIFALDEWEQDLIASSLMDQSLRFFDSFERKVSALWESGKGMGIRTAEQRNSILKVLSIVVKPNIIRLYCRLVPCDIGIEPIFPY